MKLVDDWKKSWRWATVQASAIGAALSGLAAAYPAVALEVWSSLPQELRDALDEYRFGVAASIFCAGIALRLLQRGPK